MIEPMQPVPHEELARFLAKLPDATAKLLQQHADDGHGQCMVCRVPVPCAIRSAAAAASGSSVTRALRGQAERDSQRRTKRRQP